MLVTDGDRALLGRQAVWPKGRFSTLAGFVDPGESLEDAVAREVREEAGIEVTDVTYFGNQPWPFPSSLMVGFFARATTTDIVIDDDEIEEARWFSRDELRAGAEAGTLALPGRHLDQPVADRGVVRRSAARPVVSPGGPVDQPASSASLAWTCLTDGLVCAVPSL